MLLFIRCIGDIYFQLTTFSSCFIIKFFQIRIPRGVLYELLHSLWARAIGDSKENSSHMEARQRDGFVLCTIVDNSYSWVILDASLFWKFSLYLRDIIEEEDQYTPVTFLEYLKHLHLVEWDNLVKDTKFLAGRRTRSTVRTHSVAQMRRVAVQRQQVIYLSPFYCIGFNQEFCTWVHTMYLYLGFSSCTDTLPNCFWYDELFKCH